jgi:hypothetical protein
MADPLKPQDFQSLAEPLRLDVTIAGAPVAVELRVESVDPLPPHRLREAPFSLVLAGPRSPLLPQATYAVRHPRLGPVDLFLVPVGQDAQASRYEVTFN